MSAAPEPPNGAKLVECRTCHREIVFGRTKSGKNAPLDWPPRKVYVWHPKREYFVVMDGFTPHFSTCPQADRWRGKGARE